MVFCNIGLIKIYKSKIVGHNPYFNRWFSAIQSIRVCERKFKESHNPYFNRWFSAITMLGCTHYVESGHNPYFNRWFSAIL